MAVTVREKPKGSGQWWIFINHHGKRKSKKIGSDKKIALEVANKIKAKLVLNELNVEKFNKKYPTFKELAEIWIRQPHDWKESTRQNYLSNLKYHALPFFGLTPINEIKRKDLKHFFDRLLSEGMSPNTLTPIKAPISGVLSYALDSELIEHNPLVGLKLIHKKTALDIEPLSKDKVVLLLEAAQQYENGAYYPPILLALRTGMRVGEIRALKWKDLDFEKRLIEVKRSCRHSKITKPKNGKGRKVDMSKQLAEVLRELKRKQWKKYAGKDVPQWVFTSNKGGMLVHNTFRKSLLSSLDNAGLRNIRIHDLRHTYATIRLLSGHNIGDVSYQLGHSSIKITYDTYGHWLPGRFKSEVDELDDLHPSAPYTQPKTDESKNAVLF